MGEAAGSREIACERAIADQMGGSFQGDWASEGAMEERPLEDGEGIGQGSIGG